MLKMPSIPNSVFAKFFSLRMGRIGTRSLPACQYRLHQHRCSSDSKESDKGLFLPDSAVRKLRPRKSQFLPFDEARTYVRALGLTSLEDYSAFWNRERPNFLPARPDRTMAYQTLWNGYGDFLGCSGRKRGQRESTSMIQGSDISSYERNYHRHKVHEEGVEWFRDLVEKHAPTFELELHVGSASVKFFCRKKGYNFDRWLYLAVRNGEKTVDVHGTIRFRLQPDEIRHETRCWIFMAKTQQRIYMIPPSTMISNREPRVLRPSNISISANGKYSQFSVDPEGIGDVLQSWWQSDTIPKTSKEAILDQQTRTSLILQAQRLCYEPAGMSFTSTSANLRLGYDSFIGGSKILHRCGTLFPPRAGHGLVLGLHRQQSAVEHFSASNLNQNVDVNKTEDIISNKFQFDSSESPDFYAILLHKEKVLKKMMIFPRAMLPHLVVGTSGRGRADRHVVYPSTATLCGERSLAKQEKQISFEIDLSEPLYSGPEKDKFLRILKGELN